MKRLVLFLLLAYACAIVGISAGSRLARWSIDWDHGFMEPNWATPTL